MLRFGHPSTQAKSTTVIERHHLPTGTVTHVQTTQAVRPQPTIIVTPPVQLPPAPVYVAPIIPIVPIPVFVPPAPVKRTLVATTNSRIHVEHRPAQHVAHKHHHHHGATHLHSGPTFTPLQGIHKTRHNKPKTATVVVSTTHNPNHPTGHVQVAIKRKIHK